MFTYSIYDKKEHSLKGDAVVKETIAVIKDMIT